MRKTRPAANGGPGSANAPLAQIQELYRFMVEQRLESLEYDQGGLKVRLVRQRVPAVQIPVPVPVSSAGTAGSVNVQPAVPSAPTPAGAPAVPPGTVAVKAPMMGIFYRASSPSSPPFVKDGDLVKKGQVVCLIEAMKVFNEVKVEFDCRISALLVDNGKPVKAGQDLYAVIRS